MTDPTTAPKPLPPKAAPKAALPPKVPAAPKAPLAKKAPVPAPAKVKTAPVVKKAVAPVAKAPKSTKPATENVIPKVAAIKSRHWSEEAIVLARLILDFKAAVPTFPKTGAEVRSLSPSLQVYLNTKVGLRCHRILTRPEEVKKVYKVAKTIPAELLPAKWARAIERAEKVLAD